MKKRLYALLLLLAFCLGSVPAAQGAQSKTVVLQIGNNQMAVGTAVQPVDEESAAVCPVAENNRTLVPVSRIVAAFGGESTWDAATNATSFTLNGQVVKHVIGTDRMATLTGVRRMDVPSKAMNNRTYVPMRHVLEGLGLNVEYESTQQLVVVSTDELKGKDLLSLPEAQALLHAGSQSALPGSETLIAPEISREPAETGDDTDSLSGVSIPDLAAVSGYLLAADGDPNRRESNYVVYQADFDVDRAKVRTVVEEYCDLLSSLPYLEVAQPLTTEWGYTSMGWNYTGSGAVRTGEGSSFATETPCDIDFYMEEDGREVSFWIADGIQVSDMGDQLSTGTGASTGRINGDRACDAYYYNGGVYYNSSDRRLSTSSGKAALLVNGTPCTGAVDFHTESSGEDWAVDKFTISGFRRSDWVELAFPMDHAQAGDMFTIRDFQRYDEYPYATTNMVETWAFAVSSANGSDFVMPMATADNLYDAVTVRVLRWDKTGDTVIYFYGKLLLDNQSYQIEGLLAAPNRVAGEEQSSGSGDGTSWTPTPTTPGGIRCGVCGGSGERECGSCSGRGYFERRESTPNYSGSGPKYYTVKETCGACRGTGKKPCTACGGDGKIGS